jgi:hypothetical protein
MGKTRYTDEEGGLEVRLPDGWEATRDEDRGLLVGASEGHGLLHLIPFARDQEEPLDPAEELYAFLEDHEIELQEDEIEDLALPGGAEMAVCEYLAEEAEEEVYWMVAVATGPGLLVFASYACPAARAEEERDGVRAVLTSLVLAPSSPS